MKHECGETLGDLEPVYDLFLMTSEFNLLEAVKEKSIGLCVKQVVLLAMNHRGPLPLRALHSNDETKMWRGPGRS